MDALHSELVAVVSEPDCTTQKVRKLLLAGAQNCRSVLYSALMNRNCKKEVIKDLLREDVHPTCCFTQINGSKLNAALLNTYCKQEIIQEVLNYESRSYRAHRIFFHSESPYYYLLKSPICNDSLVRLFISHGYSIKEEVEHGMVALTFAVSQSDVQIDVVRTLIAFGGVDSFSMYRAMHNPKCSSEIIHEMLCHDSYQLDKSTLREALLASRGYDTISLLINLGAPVNSKNKEGDTPLHCLAKSATIDSRILDLFLDMHVEMNPSDNLGNRPLHYAVKSWKYNFPIIRKLLIRGADICAKNSEDLTPLDIVLKKSNLSSSDIKCAELLIKQAVKKEIMTQQKIYISVSLASYLDPSSYAFGHLSKYVHACNSELLRLDVMLTNDLSLYIYMNRGIVVKETSILDSLVDIMYNNKCSVYNDLIAEYIDRDYLLNEMKNVIVFMATNEKTIHLDQRCNTIIAKSLSTIDLLNLILVYRKPPAISIIDISSKKRKKYPQCSYTKRSKS